MGEVHLGVGDYYDHQIENVELFSDEIACAEAYHFEHDFDSEYDCEYVVQSLKRVHDAVGKLRILFHTEAKCIYDDYENDARVEVRIRDHSPTTHDHEAVVIF